MALSRVSTLSCAISWLLAVTVLKDTSAELQGNGCDQGWTDFKDYCYIVVVENIVADRARSECGSLGASLSSVWSPEEKNFILSLWEFPRNQLGFLWLGLRGSDSGEWGSDDHSAVKVKQGDDEWSIFHDTSGMPAVDPTKCVALRGSGSIAFLTCSMSADAFVCKKALSKVFITSGLPNRTIPVSGPTGHVQLFERMFPPALTSLPADSSWMAEADVSSEVGCAFRCFSVNGCHVFTISCLTSQNCESLQCMLYADLIS